MPSSHTVLGSDLSLPAVLRSMVDGDSWDAVVSSWWETLTSFSVRRTRTGVYTLTFTSPLAGSRGGGLGYVHRPPTNGTRAGGA